MRRKSLNKKSLQQGGSNKSKATQSKNPMLSDLIPSIKSAIDMGASVKELMFELIQQNIPDQDINDALVESGISQDAINEAQAEIQEESMRQMQAQAQAQAEQAQASQGQLEQAQDGKEEKKSVGDIIHLDDQFVTGVVDLKADFGVDPDSQEGYELAKKLTIDAVNAGQEMPQFSCKGGGCSAIASNAAREFGVYNNRANAWDLGNKNYPQWISSNYATSLNKKQAAQDWLKSNPNADKNSDEYKTNFEAANSTLNYIPDWRYNLTEFKDNVEEGNLVGLNRADTKSSIKYADNTTYPDNRGYEHSGFMMDDQHLIHGTKKDHGEDSPYKGVYVVDDIEDGINLPGYGAYTPVETIGVNKVDDVMNTVNENDTFNKLIEFFQSIKMPGGDLDMVPFQDGREKPADNTRVDNSYLHYANDPFQKFKKLSADDFYQRVLNRLDSEINETIPTHHPQITPADGYVSQGVTMMQNAGEVIRNHGDDYEYKKEGDKYLTRLQGSDKWITSTGAAKEAIKTRIFKEAPKPKPKAKATPVNTEYLNQLARSQREEEDAATKFNRLFGGYESQYNNDMRLGQDSDNTNFVSQVPIKNLDGSVYEGNKEYNQYIADNKTVLNTDNRSTMDVLNDIVNNAGESIVETVKSGSDAVGKFVDDKILYPIGENVAEWVDKEGGKLVGAANDKGVEGIFKEMGAEEAKKFRGDTDAALDVLTKYVQENYGDEGLARFQEVYQKAGQPSISFGDPSFGGLLSGALKKDGSYGHQSDKVVSDNAELAKVLKPGYDPNDPSTWVLKTEYDSKAEAPINRSLMGTRYYIKDGQLHQTVSGRPMYDPISNAMFLDKNMMEQYPAQFLRAYIAELAHAQQRVDQGVGPLIARTLGYNAETGDHSLLFSDTAGQNRTKISNFLDTTPYIRKLPDALKQGAKDYIIENIAKGQRQIYGTTKDAREYGLKMLTPEQMDANAIRDGKIFTEAAHSYFENPTLEYILGLTGDDGQLLTPTYDPKTGAYDAFENQNQEGYTVTDTPIRSRGNVVGGSPMDGFVPIPDLSTIIKAGYNIDKFSNQYLPRIDKLSMAKKLMSFFDKEGGEKYDVGGHVHPHVGESEQVNTNFNIGEGRFTTPPVQTGSPDFTTHFYSGTTGIDNSQSAGDNEMLTYGWDKNDKKRNLINTTETGIIAPASMEGTNVNHAKLYRKALRNERRGKEGPGDIRFERDMHGNRIYSGGDDPSLANLALDMYGNTASADELVKAAGTSEVPLQFGGGIPLNISNLPGGTYGSVYNNPMASYLPIDLGLKGSPINFIGDAVQSIPKLFSGKDRDGDGAMDGLFRDRKLKRNRKRKAKALEFDYYLEDKLGNRPNQSLSNYSPQDLFEATRRGTQLEDVRNKEQLQADLEKHSRVDFDPETGEYKIFMADEDPANNLSRNKKIREAFMNDYEGMDSSIGEFLQRFEGSPAAKEKFLELFRARKDGSTFGFSPEGLASTYKKGEQNPYLYNTMMGYNMFDPNAVDPNAMSEEQLNALANSFIDPEEEQAPSQPGSGVLRFPNTPFLKTGGSIPKAQPGMEWLAGQMADQAAYEQNQMAKQQFQEDMGQYFASFNNPMGIPDGTVEFPTDPGDLDPSDLQMMLAMGQIEQSAMSNMQEGKAAQIRGDGPGGQPESDFEIKKKRKKGVLKQKLNKAKEKFGDVSQQIVGQASNINELFRSQRGRNAANNQMLESTGASAMGMTFEGPLSRGRRDLNTGIEYDILAGNSPSGYNDGSQYNKEGGEIVDLSPAMIAKLISAGADIEIK